MSREEIIAGIRALAAVIGRAPGSKLFESQAELSAHHWRGVYWARWSDALREAGFEPNLRQGKADPELMLEQLAIATRRFGHCPTAPELELYGRSWEAPSPPTVRRHFGPRHVLVVRLRRWAAARPDYADVAALLPPDPAAGPAKVRIRPSPPGGAAGAGGFVRLFAWDGRHLLNRIGDADGRQRSRPRYIPNKAVLEHAIRTDDPAGVHAYWRSRFAYRSLGLNDWFALTPEDLAAFKRWKEI